MTPEFLLIVLGGTLTIVGALIKYIVVQHNKKIDEAVASHRAKMDEIKRDGHESITQLSHNCTKVAERVQQNVDNVSQRLDSLAREVDAKTLKLDTDIKNVGAKLTEQLARLTHDLFEKIDQNRRELGSGIQGVNNRLDNIFNNRTPPPQI
jgi:DNA anti-recombination protein RmuC